jgi:hypothetical protein
MTSHLSMPSFRQIRQAILQAPTPPQGFPLHQLREEAFCSQVHQAPALAGFRESFREEAKRASSSRPEPLTFQLFRLFEQSGERAPYEEPYFDRQRRLAGLTLACVLDDDPSYLIALSDLIWEICELYTWSLPAHIPVGLEAAQNHFVPPEQVVDLFAAHIAHGLAEVSVLLGDKLDPWLHYRIRNEIERRIFQPLFNSPVHFGWESAPMNWSAVCAGCAGMAALALEQDRERLAGMIDRVVRAMECFLEGFGNDGGCAEGIGYWVYGFGFYTYFAETLYEYSAGALDLLQGDKIAQIAQFPNSISLGHSSYINYSDAPDHAAIPAGLGSRLYARLGQQIADLPPPNFHEDHCYRWGHISRDLIWTSAQALDRPVTSGTFYLEDLEWLIERRVEQGTTVAFSAKGGHNAEPHNHNDLGHFILHLGGENLLADLGAGVYTRQYFGPERYSFLHNGSHGHSLPLINGASQAAGSEHRAQILRHEQQANTLTFELDLSSAYQLTELESFQRSFTWHASEDQAKLDLRDSFRFSLGDQLIEECFISLRKPELAAGQATWSNPAGRVQLNYDATSLLAQLDSFESQNHSLAAITVYRLRLISQSRQAEQTHHFQFLLLPNKS